MAATRTFNADARGFTLTELLVGMLLTLVVTGGALLAFDQAIRGTDMARLRLGMGDQVRIGLDLMTRDFIQIGNGLPNGKVMPVPNGTGAGAIHRPGPSLADFPLGTTTDLSAVIPGAQLGPLINGVQSDVISMLYVDPAFDNPAVAAENPRHCTMANNGRTCVFATNVGTMSDALRAGDLLMITGTGTTMMMVTDVSPANTAHFDDGDAMNLNQPAAPSGSVAQINPTPGHRVRRRRRARQDGHLLDSGAVRERLVRADAPDQLRNGATRRVGARVPPGTPTTWWTASPTPRTCAIRPTRRRSGRSTSSWRRDRRIASRTRTTSCGCRCHRR